MRARHGILNDARLCPQLNRDQFDSKVYNVLVFKLTPYCESKERKIPENKVDLILVPEYYALYSNYIFMQCVCYSSRMCL